MTPVPKARQKEEEKEKTQKEAEKEEPQKEEPKVEEKKEELRKEEPKVEEKTKEQKQLENLVRRKARKQVMAPKDYERMLKVTERKNQIESDLSKNALSENEREEYQNRFDELDKEYQSLTEKADKTLQEKGFNPEKAAEEYKKKQQENQLLEERLKKTFPNYQGRERIKNLNAARKALTEEFEKMKGDETVAKEQLDQKEEELRVAATRYYDAKEERKNYLDHLEEYERRKVEEERQKAENERRKAEEERQKAENERQKEARKQEATEARIKEEKDVFEEQKKDWESPEVEKELKDIVRQKALKKKLGPEFSEKMTRVGILREQLSKDIEDKRFSDEQHEKQKNRLGELDKEYEDMTKQADKALEGFDLDKAVKAYKEQQEKKQERDQKLIMNDMRSQTAQRVQEYKIRVKSAKDALYGMEVGVNADKQQFDEAKRTFDELNEKYKYLKDSKKEQLNRIEKEEAEQERLKDWEKQKKEFEKNQDEAEARKNQTGVKRAEKQKEPGLAL